MPKERVGNSRESRRAEKAQAKSASRRRPRSAPREGRARDRDAQKRRRQRGAPLAARVPHRSRLRPASTLTRAFTDADFRRRPEPHWNLALIAWMRMRTSTPRRGIREVGEDPIDAEVPELPVLGAGIGVVGR